MYSEARLAIQIDSSGLYRTMCTTNTSRMIVSCLIIVAFLGIKSPEKLRIWSASNDSEIQIARWCAFKRRQNPYDHARYCKTASFDFRAMFAYNRKSLATRDWNICCVPLNCRWSEHIFVPICITSIALVLFSAPICMTSIALVLSAHLLRDLCVYSRRSKSQHCVATHFGKMRCEMRIQRRCDARIALGSCTLRYNVPLLIKPYEYLTKPKHYYCRAYAFVIVRSLCGFVLSS